MNKQSIKNAKREEQEGLCYLSEKQLSRVNKLTDLSKFVKRQNGGATTHENTRLVDPVEHMKHNGNYREREDKIALLKSLIDARNNLMKAKTAKGNSINAMMRGTDYVDSDTAWFFAWSYNCFQVKIEEKEKQIKKVMDDLKEEEPVLKAAEGVKGVGIITLAYCLVYVNPYIADTASKVWSYAGLHRPAHKRYEKSERGKYECGNKPLRTALYTMADSTLKTNGAYRPVYDATKAKLEQSEKLTETRLPGNSGTKTVMWKDASDGHRDGAGKRSIMKHFLADYLYVARKKRGLPMRGLYVEEYLGHSGIVHPSERGWDVE